MSNGEPIPGLRFAPPRASGILKSQAPKLKPDVSLGVFDGLLDPSLGLGSWCLGFRPQSGRLNHRTFGAPEPGCSDGGFGASAVGSSAEKPMEESSN